MVNQQRPINLELSSLKHPITSIASILHRISGVILFLLLPLMIYMLGESLRSSISFANLQHFLTQPINKLLLWAFGAALIYHLFAGIRHMIMDLGFGEHIHTARRSALVVIILAIISTIVLGVCIW